MDRQQRTLNVVTTLNSFQEGITAKHLLLNEVCEYFDFIKDKDIDDADRRFLLYLSSKVGVPHYYDILYKFNKDRSLVIDEDNICLSTFSSLLYESSLYTDDHSKLHQYQKEILDLFSKEKINRYFLSASTSFGKTHLVYEIIKKMHYNNIVLIFPSIALLTENLAKIKNGTIKFSEEYNVHTLSDFAVNPKENNIFIFTPERFLSFLDKNHDVQLDFIFIDEVYKIDNGYIIDNEAKENERDVAYRMSLFYGFSKYTNIDIFLAGPYIEVFDQASDGYNPSFDLFLRDFGIEKLLRNEYEIVKVTKTDVENERGRITIDGLDFNFTRKSAKKAKIQELLDRILLNSENAIVYCNTQGNAEKVAKDFDRAPLNTAFYKVFLDHLLRNFDPKWIVIEALQKGVGVHHGMVPKYIQKEIISLFNSPESGVRVLTSTTTITEGVNTTAKNMIVYKSEKGGGRYGKPLLTFDAKNIAGRAGRFMEHYTGRLITLDKEFMNVINDTGEQITHKNYDLNVEKKEIDDEMTPEQYLDDRSRERLLQIRAMQEARGIPDQILSQFKVISKRDKIKIYDNIAALSPLFHQRIKRFIARLNAPRMALEKDGFQVILDVIYEVVENETLKAMIENTFKDKYSPNHYSILFAALNSYLSTGFNGVYNYNLRRENNPNSSSAVNSAMRKTSSLIYNTFKYQLVKYIGVFNLMYKFYISERDRIPYEDATGIDVLLIKLEYNAFSEEARIASDYGVPQKIIDYYDSPNQNEANRIQGSFDGYEKTIFERINNIINK